MLVSKSHFVEPYWDEGQRGPNYYPSYRKGRMKKINGKRWIRQRLRELDRE